jgi:hypothetical protein
MKTIVIWIIIIYIIEGILWIIESKQKQKGPTT